jgi:hypothetical protein
MKKTNKMVAGGYDFKNGVRGKYYRRFREGTNLVLLDPDVARFFPDSKSANDALRAIAGILNRRLTSPAKT